MGNPLNKREYHLLRKYGITEGQYNDLLQQQRYSCGICHRPANEFKAKLCVDHDHITGHVRGLLCSYCNHRVVGRLRRDTIQPIYDYLIKEYPGWVVPPKVKKRKKRKWTRKKKIR